MKLFSVQDLKAGIFLNPMAFRNANEALRAFQTTVRDPKSQFNLYPADFVLVELGSFNVDTGEITPHRVPVSLATAADFVQQSPVIPSQNLQLHQPTA